MLHANGTACFTPEPGSGRHALPPEAQHVDRKNYFLHQVHPAKLATDISASIVSSIYFWKRRPIEGIVTALVPPIIASSLVMRTDLSWLENTTPGQYVLSHMPPAAQAVRLSGAAIMAYGSWQRRPGIVVLGLLVVVAVWSDGIIHKDL